MDDKSWYKIYDTTALLVAFIAILEGVANIFYPIDNTWTWMLVGIYLILHEINGRKRRQKLDRI